MKRNTEVMRTHKDMAELIREFARTNDLTLTQASKDMARQMKTKKLKRKFEDDFLF